MISACILGMLSMQSCEKDKGDEINVLAEWLINEYIVFPDGCRIDEGTMVYGDMSVDLGSSDAVVYTFMRSSFAIDFKCVARGLPGDVELDIKNIAASAGGPSGHGYTESYIYYIGGLAMRFSPDVWASPVAGPEISATFVSNGLRMPAEVHVNTGEVSNNRALRCKYRGNSKMQDITENLKYECDIDIDFTVGGKTGNLRITKISPL